MANDTVNKLAYLLGVPEAIIQPQFADEQSLETIAATECVPEIRARCRARQVALFHYTGGKKIFRLPDSLRSYCVGGIFDELQQEFLAAYDSWEFANRMTDFVVENAQRTLEALDIPHPDILLELIFKWPTQNKSTFLALSQQYHNKKFSFPYAVFIPKPKTFEDKLPYLLTNDETLFSSVPIALAISSQAGEAKMELREAPEPFQLPNTTYIDSPFSPSSISYQEGVCCAYVDYDNMPPFLAAQICKAATKQHPAKVFYDDRVRGDIEVLKHFPFVEFCFVERLKSEKSLVDSRILTEIMRDCYTSRPRQVTLYSSDSDFFALAPILKQEGISFTVIALEGHVSPTYIEKLGEYDVNSYILSKLAVVPVPDEELIRSLLRYQLLHTVLGECRVQDVVQKILGSFSEEKYHTMLAKNTETEIEKLLAGAKLVVKNGGIVVEF